MEDAPYTLAQLALNILPPTHVNTPALVASGVLIDHSLWGCPVQGTTLVASLARSSPTPNQSCEELRYLQILPAAPRGGCKILPL